MRSTKSLAVMIGGAVLGLSSTAACFAQADTQSPFVTWEHQGSPVATRYDVNCGHAGYTLSSTQGSWTLTRDGEPISASVDEFLSTTLEYFDRVALSALNCGDFEGPGITEGLTFNVVKQFEDGAGGALQYGSYTILLEGSRISGHYFTAPAARDRPQPQIIEDFYAFARERNLSDVPGVKPYWPG